MYQGLINRPFWQNDPLYKRYIDIAKAGRQFCYDGPATAPVVSFLDKKFVGNMLQNFLVKKVSAKEAWAGFYKECKGAWDSAKEL